MSLSFAIPRGFISFTSSRLPFFFFKFMKTVDYKTFFLLHLSNCRWGSTWTAGEWHCWTPGFAVDPMTR